MTRVSLENDTFRLFPTTHLRAAPGHLNNLFFENPDCLPSQAGESPGGDSYKDRHGNSSGLTVQVQLRPSNSH